MRDAALIRITEPGALEWPWATPTGLAIITGAAGGGGGGGGEGCENGSTEGIGANGSVVLVPLHVDQEVGRS